MIVIRVELHSAVTGDVTELARMIVANTGGTASIGNYACATLHGRDKAALDRQVVQRRGHVIGHEKQRLHVWNLVAKALAAMGYGKPPAATTATAKLL